MAFLNCQKSYMEVSHAYQFWSFAYIIIKGSWAKVGSDILISLKMTGLQSWSVDFFLYFTK